MNFGFSVDLSKKYPTTTKTVPGIRRNMFNSNLTGGGCGLVANPVMKNPVELDMKGKSIKNNPRITSSHPASLFCLIVYFCSLKVKSKWGHLMLNVYTDGSGKTGKYAFFVEEKNEMKVFQKRGITNNQAEYLAIIEVLKFLPKEDLTILSDSNLAVSQINHEFAIKNDSLRELAQEVWKMSEGRKVELKWIERSKNKAGKFLG